MSVEPDELPETLVSIADRINEIIDSAESLYRDAHLRPSKKLARQKRNRRIRKEFDSLITQSKESDQSRDSLSRYMSACKTRGITPAEWTQGWLDLFAQDTFYDFVQRIICEIPCRWRCERRCRVNFPYDFIPKQNRRRLRNAPIRIAVTKKPNRAGATTPLGRPPARPVDPPTGELTHRDQPQPVAGCAVASEMDGQARCGEVVRAFPFGNTSIVEVAWGRKREVMSHMPSELNSGFQAGDTVQEIPESNAFGSRGTGKVIATQRIGDDQLVTVEFDDSAEIKKIPFQRLARVVNTEDKFLSAKPADPDDAERFRLKCLAYALEAWNEGSGSLGRMPVDPMPHQIGIVNRILNSDQTNWLIADDVGLGKTIEVGLLLAAKKGQRRLNRALIVCPASLTTQWRDEMKFKFGEEYRIYGHDFKVDQQSDWRAFDYDNVIVSIDKAKLEQHNQTIRRGGPWDIVVFDEAHHLSYHGHSAPTLRYELALLLRDQTDEFIFLTGTPHQGNDEQFLNLLRLLRPDLVRKMSEPNIDPGIVAEIILKNRKDKVTDENGKPVFHGQDTYRRRADVSSHMEEFQCKLEQYLKDGYAASETGGSQRRAIGFVMTTYRKLASSSIVAIMESLKRRRRRLEGDKTFSDTPSVRQRLDDQRESIQEGADSDIYDLDILAEAEVAGSLGDNEFFDHEKSQLDELIKYAERAQAQDLKLKTFLREIAAPVFKNGEKLLIFTEYRETQKYLERELRNEFRYVRIATINGGMDLETKRKNIDSFNCDAKFMISTEAGGEGINLHERCHTLVNYDIPWNPRRLVQRAGRLYRYGQKRRVNVYNLLVDDGFDNKALSLMLVKVD